MAERAIVVTAEELDGIVERAVRRVLGTVPTLTVLTVEQAAERLGIGRKQVNKLCRTGAITATKVGKSYRIKIADLDRYLGGNDAAT